MNAPHMPTGCTHIEFAESAHSGFYDQCEDTRTLRNVIESLDSVLTDDSPLDEHLTRGRLARRLYVLRRDAA